MHTEGRHVYCAQFHLRYVFFFNCPFFPEMFLSFGDYKMLHNFFRGAAAGIRKKENFTDEDLEAWKFVFSQPGECS